MPLFTSSSSVPRGKTTTEMIRSKEDLSSETSSFETNDPQQVHDWVEHDLVETVCFWCNRVLMWAPGLAAVVLYLTGDDSYVNPASVSIFTAVTSRFLSGPTQTSLSLIVLAYIIVVHSLSQGCSASLVPTIFTLFPCAFGFIHRSQKAVILATCGVLAAVFYIFYVDLTGQCTTEPIQSHETMRIIADRLLCYLNPIVGNCLVLTAIVGQSERSLLLHAKATETATKLAKVRRDVLHRVTHELRTPINGVVGSVELLIASETMESADMENALTIKSCLNTIVEICNNVLLAAESSTSGTNKAKRRHPTTFRLANTVDAVAEIFTATASVKGVDLKVEYLAPDVWVRGMEVALRQVLVNLVGNAVKFTETGGITVRVMDMTRASSSKNHDGTITCKFEVEDTGIGLDMKTAKMLFEPFHQGENGAVSRRHQGSGLGLTIGKEFVEQMGGTLEVEGEHDRGTRFWFSLNLEKAESPPTEHESTFCSTDEKACHIAIYDPEEGSSVSCQNMIKSAAPGATITSVASLSELQNVIAADPPPPCCGTNSHRIAFVSCDDTDSEMAAQVLSKIRGMGWIALAYCGHSNFVDLVTQSRDAYAVFRRPLPLVRIHKTLLTIFEQGAEAYSEPTEEGEMKSDSVTEEATEDKDLFSIGTQEENFLREGTLPECPSNATTNALSSDKDSVSTSKPCNEGNIYPKDTTWLEVPSKATNALLTAKDSLYSSSHHGESACRHEKTRLENPSNATCTPMSRQPSTRMKRPLVELRPGTKIVVVDDTPVNVKVLTKMLERSTSTPVVSCSDGQSAVELVLSADPKEHLLFLMDWHMPGVCGLSASGAIHQLVLDKGFPYCRVCMVTADIEGLWLEMDKRGIRPEGTLSKGSIAKVKNPDQSTTMIPATEGHSKNGGKANVVDLVTAKPVTFKCVETILKWFQEISRESPVEQ